MKYPIMSLSETLKYEDEASEKKVSKVARGSNGFLGFYKKYKNFDNFKNRKAPNSNMTWENKRDSFVARHLAQYKISPTRRRQLALLMWSYKI